MKRKIIFVLTLLLLVFSASSLVKAEDYIPLIDYNGQTVNYRNSNTNVMMPVKYQQQDRYMRAIWVTPLAGNIGSYKTMSQYQKEILQMLDVMEYYNLNAVIFHVRIYNDALYSSTMNPRSNYLNTDWDALTWVINECHKRGIEFHAWMNPYRVKSSGGTTAENEAQIIKNKAPNNVGADPNNLLVSTSGGVILNPGLEVVRQFLCDTVVELMSNYDVDAIHFDDYFYIANIDDTDTYQKNNPNNLGIADWRREQCNLFISKLSQTIRAFNAANNKYVQLGISPTGIYRNGNGVVTYDTSGNAITNGSNTSGQEHYASYLYSDTKKWIDEEWLDYIMPQSYWGFTHPVAGYADVMDWWNKVCEYKNVNLYSGMGIYMSATPNSNYSWGRDINEAPNQILFATTLKNVQGTVFYNYGYLLDSYRGNTTSLYSQGLKIVKEELFTSPSVLPQIKSMTPVVLDDVTNLTVTKESSGNVISFNPNQDAKQYVIYRSKADFKYDNSEIIAITGHDGTSKVVVTDNTTEDYNYSVRVLSKTNTLSPGAKYNHIKYEVKFFDYDGSLLTTLNVGHGESVSAPTPSIRENHQFVGWSRDITNITSDIEVHPKYDDSLYKVTFYDNAGTVLKTQEVARYQNATAPAYSVEGYQLDGWTEQLTNVIFDLDVKPVLKPMQYTVKFLGFNDVILSTQIVLYKESPVVPRVPAVDDYNFVSWDKDFTEITSDLEVRAIYKLVTFKVTFVLESDPTVIIDVQEVEKGSDAVPPTTVPDVKGQAFERWMGSYTNIVADMVVKARYYDAEYEITFYDYSGEVYETLYVYYLDPIDMPAGPVKDGYLFKGWDKQLTPEDLYQDIDVYPLFDVIGEIKHKVTYYDQNGQLLGVEEVVDGEKPKFIYPAPVVTGYHFTGWDYNDSPVNKDITINAKYEINTYTVTYLGANGFKETEIVTHNELPKLSIVVPEQPGMTFTGWDYDGKPITSDITINAKYDILSFTVTYLSNDNAVLLTEEVLYNGTPSLSAIAPVIVGKTFVGWDYDSSLITANITIKPLYETSVYTVSYIGKDGTVIATEKVEYNQLPKLEIEVPTIKNFKFDKFDYDNEPVTSDISITLVYKEEGGCLSNACLSWLAFFSLGIMAIRVIVLKRKN